MWNCTIFNLNFHNNALHEIKSDNNILHFALEMFFNGYKPRVEFPIFQMVKDLHNFWYRSYGYSCPNYVIYIFPTFSVFMYYLMLFNVVGNSNDILFHAYLDGLGGDLVHIGLELRIEEVIINERQLIQKDGLLQWNSLL